MTITVFGASGKTGVEVIKECINNNYRVIAFVRNKNKLQQFANQIQIVEGSVFNINDINRAVSGSDCVISVLGHSKNTPSNMQTEATKNIIKSMEQNHIKRFMSLTGSGVFVEGDKPSLIENLINGLLNVIDKPRMEDGKNFVEEVKKSNLDWTIFRAFLLTNAKASGKTKLLKVGEKDTKLTVSRKDIAKKFLEIINDPTTFSNLPYIS